MGQPFKSLAIIQLHALSLLQKTLQIRDQFFLYRVCTQYDYIRGAVTESPSSARTAQSRVRMGASKKVV
jgi:hypothetical protein